MGTAIIIGAGPAGLTAAYELATRTNITPIVVEQTDQVGGLSRTVEYQGNRIDIGGHRFFSKSDRVMQWWLNLLPLEAGLDPEFRLRFQRQERGWVTDGEGPDPRTTDEVMLLRSRKSRIFYGGRFYDYPLSLSVKTIGNMGLLRTALIGLSYLRARLTPRTPEVSLEDFLINRFGRRLYETFFRSCTEKVWGQPCDQISAEWGAQRIKGLSVLSALRHFFRSLWRKRSDLSQKSTETSLIERFLYPKYGPGQMWEVCADRIRALGGQIHMSTKLVRLMTTGDQVKAAIVRNENTGKEEEIEAEFFFSTMPVRSLVRALGDGVPESVRSIAKGLVYRDFITVGLLLRKMKLQDRFAQRPYPPDNWIYIQEPNVQVGRLQIFNNWSPYLVADADTVWVGLEYFCNEGDPLWQHSDQAMQELAIEELVRLGLIERTDALDATVIRVPKAYPAYFGSYDRFGELRQWLDQYENLFLIGRNGMHRYNNQDHSMLTAMVAVDNILMGQLDKANVWEVNTEQEYHEVAKQAAPESRHQVST
jgi:protoporphyrinogen oxidase